MRISIVILNWNTREYLQRWLPALLESCRRINSSGNSSASVTVADNASTDDSVRMLSESFPGVRTIVLDRNYGFTGGYNRAFEGDDADLYVLINSDIEVRDGWLEPLVQWMEEHPLCAVCGPKILSLREEGHFEYAGAAGGYLDRFGYPFCRGRVFSRVEKDCGQYDTPESVLWVSGACMMVRSCVWKSLGGLDSRFFAHMEEIDFCWRAALDGYSVDVVPASQVKHLGGGTLSKDSPFKLKLNYRNNLLMLEKNLPRTVGSPRAGLRIFTRMILDIVMAMVYLACGKWKSFKAVLDAHSEFRELSTGIRKGIRTGTQIAGYRNNFIIFEYLKNS